MSISGRRRGNKELLERRELALSYIKLQKSNADAMRGIVEKWGVSQSTAEKDVRRAWVHLGEQEDAIERPMRKHQLRSSLKAIYVAAMQSKKYGPAIQAIDRMARLDGLFTDIQINHTGTINTVRQMTSDDQRQELAQLLGMYLGETEEEPGNGHDNDYNGGNGAAHH